MKKVISDLGSWKKLSIAEKNVQVNKYWIKNKVSEKIKNEIIKEFLETLSGRKDLIKNIKFGWDGWYSPVLIVTIHGKNNIKIPRIYDIFEVKKVFA